MRRALRWLRTYHNPERVPPPSGVGMKRVRLLGGSCCGTIGQRLGRSRRGAGRDRRPRRTEKPPALAVGSRHATVCRICRQRIGWGRWLSAVGAFRAMFAPPGGWMGEALAARITEGNRHPLVDWGPPVGREVQ